MGPFIVRSGSEPSPAVSFYSVFNIYADPCQAVLLDPPVGPTVDDLVAALEHGPGYAATGAHDVTFRGVRRDAARVHRSRLRPGRVRRGRLRPVARH